MKKNLFSLVACFLLGALAAWADEPFRNHRYDAFKVCRITPQSIVFIGNSITNMHDWHAAFDNPNVVNRGVSGAYTSEVLANLESFIAGKPAKIFMMIGTNDLGTEGINNTPYVVNNIRQIIERVQAESPATELYIQSILPSQSGIRNLKIISETNAALKTLCEEKKVTYVDLYNDLMGIIDNTHSRDGLHLSASGYRIWCDKIAPYVGSECVYPATASNQYVNGLAAAYNMRVSCWGMTPVKSSDVLMIGDEMINGGEWHELLHCDAVKNYGQAWGYPGASLANTLSMLPILFKGRTDNEAPAKVFLYAGVADVNGSTALSTVKNSYKSILDKIHELAPATKVYVMSLQPTGNAGTNSSRVKPFNELLKELVAADENAEYVDIYTDFEGTNGAGDSRYFNGNYLWGRGYAKVSEVLAPLIEGATPTTVAEADELMTLLNARNTLGSAISLAASVEVGEGVGQYPAHLVKALTDEVAVANALLSKDGVAIDELTAEAAKVQAAVDALLPGINMPKVSNGDNEYWYQFYTPQRGSRYLTSNGVGAGVTGAGANAYAQSMWKFTENANGGWNLVNRKDGSFLNPVAAYNAQLTTQAAEPSKGWEVSYSGTLGLYILQSGNVQINQTNLENKVYNWSTGGTTNDRTDAGCQYAIVDAEPLAEPPAAPKADLVLTDITLDGSQPYQIEEELAKIVLEAENITVAIDVTLSDNNSEQCLVGSSNSTAAQEYVSVFVNTGGKFGVRFNDGSGLYTGNGVVGTSRHKVVVTMQPENPSYTYYLDGGKVRDIAAVSPIFSNVSGVDGLYLGGVVCSGNPNKYPMRGTIHSVQFFTSYLSGEQVAAINYDGLVPTGISQIPASAAEKNAVYDLSGRRVSRPGRGVFITNGKVVIR